MASAVLMVRPAAFASNPETAESNAFQAPASDAAAADTLYEQARTEFDAAARVLREAGVRVLVMEDSAEPPKPDAVFPNNWFSTDSTGTLVLFPMLAPSRRNEVRVAELVGLLDAAFPDNACARQIVDCRRWQREGLFLEGTGSIVLSHRDHTLFAAVSPRTSARAVERFCALRHYAPVVFEAFDASGTAIYHTNVLMSVSDGLAVVCSKAIAEADRERVLSALAGPPNDARVIVDISLEQMAAFCGNVLVVQRGDGGHGSILVLSSTAHAAFTQSQHDRLLAGLGANARLAVLPIPTIERYGGGSARCMLAEIFCADDSARTSIDPSSGQRASQQPSS